MFALRRNAGAGRAWRMFDHHPRYFADRGLNRKDYTDPGFQTSGYINPSWFASTHEGKFKSPQLPREPVYCGSTEVRRNLKARRMGEARKQFEREKSKVEAARKRNSMKPPTVRFKDEIVPELELVDEAQQLSKTLKLKQRRMNGKRIIVFKGRVLKEDYDGFEYPESGLDDFTNKVLKKQEKKKRTETTSRKKI